MLKYKIYIQLILYLSPFCGIKHSCFANQRLLDSVQLSIHSGIRTIHCDSFAMINHLDYVNSINKYNQSAYVEITLDLNWSEKFSSSVQWMIIDSYVFNNYSITTNYYPFKFFGFSLGYYSFDYFLENYNHYYLLNYNQYTIIDDDGFFQRRTSEQAIIFGPSFIYGEKKFVFDLQLLGGFIQNKPFSETFTLKEKNTNYIQQHIIKTHAHRSTLFYPKLKLEYYFIHSKKTSMGFQLHGNLLLQDKSIDYDQTVFRWTQENKETVLVLNSKHKFIKYEMGIGFTIKW